MLYQLLADVITLIHLSFVGFVVLGGLLAFRWKIIVWLHIPAAAWGAFVEFSGRICPLTPLENALRQQAGDAGYSGDFVTHYLLPILYPSHLTEEIQLMLGAAVVLINCAIYVLLWQRNKSGAASP